MYFPSIIKEIKSKNGKSTIGKHLIEQEEKMETDKKVVGAVHFPR